MRTTEQKRSPGDYLRRLRSQLGLTTRLVAHLSHAIALEQQCEEFSISHTRLVQVENEESAPSIFKLFTLSAIYGVTLTDLLAAYVDLDAPGRLHSSMEHASTHPCSFDAMHSHRATPIPMQMGSGTTLANTSLMAQIADLWEEVPASVLSQMSQGKHRYGLIGLSDYTMFPLIRPGSFVQIDECRRPAPKCEYRTEFDRPIYFIELRGGYICSWCEIVDGRLISVPHPLSPCRLRQFAFPSEAEIIGRVTGVAVRFGPPAAGMRPKAKPESAVVAVATPECAGMTPAIAV